MATLLIATFDAFRVERLASQADRVQESERRELSRELHDRVGPNLTALGINLGLLKTGLATEPHPELRSRLEDSIGLVESTCRCHRKRDVGAASADAR